jgi:hypothetical protein
MVHATSFTRFYIHDFEFRKFINPTDFEAWISINNRLLTSTANLIKLFRDDNDAHTRFIAQKFGVFLRFEDSRGRIKIVNNTHFTDMTVHRLEGALSEVIDRITKDMEYLKRKSKLPHMIGGVRAHQHPPRVAIGRASIAGWDINAPPPVSEPGEIPQATDHRKPTLSASVPPPAPPPSPAPSPALAPEAPAAVPVPSSTLPAPQGTAGLIAIVYQPTPEILSKLFLNNIQYSLAPEFLFTQMFQQITP